MRSVTRRLTYLIAGVTFSDVELQIVTMTESTENPRVNSSILFGGTYPMAVGRRSEAAYRLYHPTTRHADTVQSYSVLL